MYVRSFFYYQPLIFLFLCFAWQPIWADESHITPGANPAAHTGEKPKQYTTHKPAPHLREGVPFHGMKASLGVSGGAISGSAATRIFVDQHNFQGDIKIQGPQLGFFGTLGYVFDNNLYVGGEIGYLWASTKETTCDSVAHALLDCLTLKMKTSWDFIAHVGYAIAGDVNVLPFLKLGAVITKFKSNGNHHTLVTPPSAASGSTSRYVSGFSVGAGVDFQLTDYLWGGFSYDHTWYNSFSYMISDVHTTKIRPETDIFRLRLRTVF